MTTLIVSFLLGAFLLLAVVARKKMYPGKAGTFTLPKLSMAGHGPLIAKVVGSAVIVLLVYYFPSLVKESMPGKAMLSALGSNAGWYEWIWWIPAGIIAFLAIQKIWKKAAATGSKPSESNSTWILLLMVGLLIAGLSSMVTKYATGGTNLPSLVMVRFDSPIKPGSTKMVTGGYTSVYRIGIPPNPKAWNNQGVGWSVCPELVRPKKPPVPIEFAWETNNQVFDMTMDKATIARLTENNAADLAETVELQFTLVGPAQAGGATGCDLKARLEAEAKAAEAAAAKAALSELAKSKP